MTLAEIHLSLRKKKKKVGFPSPTRDRFARDISRGFADQVGETHRTHFIIPPRLAVPCCGPKERPGV